MEKPDFLIKNGSDYYSSLEIDCFANMLKDPSSCYKFFWLEAIVNLVNQNISKTTIGEHLILKPKFYESKIYTAAYRVDKSNDEYDKTIDFVLFKRDLSEFPDAKQIKLGDSDEMSIGSEVKLIGFPDFSTGTYTILPSHIIKKGRYFEADLYEVDNLIKHGFSGGIVLNESLEVVGIVKAGIEIKDETTETEMRIQKYGFVPINLVKEYCGL